uniref:Transmembrane protein n=1 Tax=Cucumis melo TaxID=3656 RepID=A0A9I9EF12_CUCME
MAPKKVPMILNVVFFIIMLLISSNNNYNVSARKFLDVNIPLVDDAFNLDQMDKLDGELQKRFEDLLKTTTDNDIPRGGNY